MTEILHSLFFPLSNAIMSGLMVVVLLYWIFSFLGIGFGDMDIDADFGADIDSDVDVDADTDVDAHSHGGSSTHSDVDDTHVKHESSGDGVFMKFLKFMNIGKVPFMLVLSTLKFFTWAASLITTQITVAGSWGWKSVFILIPCLIIGIFLTKLATNPLAKFLKKTGYHGEERTEFLGRSGKMLSSIHDDKIGSAEFIIEKNPIKLNVISHSGENIKYGDTVMITDDTKDGKVYYVTREITLDQN